MKPLQSSRISQVALTVSDLDRATAFYRDQLGLPFLFPAGNMSFFSVERMMFMLAVPEGETPPPFVIYFEVDAIQSVHGELRDSGVEFISEPHVVHRDDSQELWMAFFRDPEGNLLALREARRTNGS